MSKRDEFIHTYTEEGAIRRQEEREGNFERRASFGHGFSFLLMNESCLEVENYALGRADRRVAFFDTPYYAQS